VAPSATPPILTRSPTIGPTRHGFDVPDDFAPKRLGQVVTHAILPHKLRAGDRGCSRLTGFRSTQGILHAMNDESRDVKLLQTRSAIR
jgi:hypothetical protein